MGGSQVANLLHLFSLRICRVAPHRNLDCHVFNSSKYQDDGDMVILEPESSTIVIYQQSYVLWDIGIIGTSTRLPPHYKLLISQPGLRAWKNMASHTKIHTAHRWETTSRLNSCGSDGDNFWSARCGPEGLRYSPGTENLGDEICIPKDRLFCRWW